MKGILYKLSVITLFLCWICPVLACSEVNKRVQVILNLSGYDVGKADGIAGIKTKRALKNAFNDYDFNFSGKINRNTIETLYKVYFEKEYLIWAEQDHLMKLVSISDARHFLERTGIGAHPREIDKLVGKTRASVVKELMTEYNTLPKTTPPQFVKGPTPNYFIRGDFKPQEREVFEASRDKEILELRNWWVNEMILTDSPQTERLMLYWTNHFPVAYSSLWNESTSIAKQHFMLRKNGFGNFRLLICEVIKDPATLAYLDNEYSNKLAVNENLARELMELFVLGEGNYDEKDIKEAARALTGFGFSNIQDGLKFHLSEWGHDKTKKELFGKRGNFDGFDLVNILFSQPAASKHLTKKLWKYYISQSHTDEIEVEEIAKHFAISDFEIPILLADIFTSEGFWNDKNRGTVVKSPIDLIIGFTRTTGYPYESIGIIQNELSIMGQNIFEPPNVAGWPGGPSWVTPSRFLYRTKLMEKLFDQSADKIEMEKNTGKSMKGHSEDYLLIRYASENFKGPPKFKINLLQKTEGSKFTGDVIWSSTPIEAKKGIDTEISGKISASNLNWQIEKIRVPSNITFDLVSIEYLNEFCCGAGGADRNLYFDWLKYDEKSFYASKGDLFSPYCYRKDDPGSMFCNGKLIIPQNNKVTKFKQPTRQDNKQIKDKLFIDRVALHHLKKFDNSKEFNEFSINLLNVKFNNNFQRRMRVSLVYNSKFRSWHLNFQSRNCSDNCFEGNWPVRSRKKNDEKSQHIFWGVEEKEWQRKYFDTLNNKDKRFVAALWKAVPQIIEKMQEGTAFKTRGADFQSWDNALKNFKKYIKKSRYIEYSRKQEIKISEKLVGAVQNNQDSSVKISSAEVIKSKRENILKVPSELKNLLNNSDMQESPHLIFLAEKPLNSSSATQEVTIEDFIKYVTLKLDQMQDRKEISEAYTMFDDGTIGLILTSDTVDVDSIDKIADRLTASISSSNHLKLVGDIRANQYNTLTKKSENRLIALKFKSNPHINLKNFFIDPVYQLK